MSFISLGRRLLPSGSLFRRSAARVYARAIRVKDRGGIRSRFPTGEEFLLDPVFYNFDWLSAEPQIHAWLKQHLKGGMTFFDVGAWVGSYSLVAARWVGSNGHVVSFEPSDTARILLKRHLEMNQLTDRVRVIDAAVADEDGVTTFYELSRGLEASNSIAYRKDLVGIERSTLSEVQKPVIQLDTFVGTQGLIPDIVKVDVEGAEVRVLVGAKVTLRVHRPLVICSVHPNWLSGLEDSMEGLFALLEEVDYDMVDFDGRRCQMPVLEEVLLVPRST